MKASKVKAAIVSTLMGGMIVWTGCRTGEDMTTAFAPFNATLPTHGPSYLETPAEPSLPIFNDRDVDISSISPDAMIDYANVQYLPISLDECISRALAESEVFRDLGGSIVAQPAVVGTSLDPAIQFSDPSSGEAAALSAFDANLRSGLFFENNDRPFNNLFTGDGTGILKQDLAEYNVEINKISATGTSFTSRSTINYDANSQAMNRFGSSYEAIIDTGFRHPLLQGSGSLFNRIAGPSQTPGNYNGILIARTNTEISQADFEEQAREFVSNVENSYWDLYYAYRELNAQTDARDAAYAVFKNTETNAESERISGLEKASAEEQYLRFEHSIIQSLEGRPIEGTQSNSGTTGGTFRRTVGVRVAERRLRYLLGMAITDGALLQPADKPIKAPLVFDWDDSVHFAIVRRPETRRQRWVVKQRELELTASRNFLKPRLDLVGNYRFRGLGKNLTGGGESLGDDIANGSDDSGAFSDLASGNFQELALGAELTMPVGFRRAHAAVRNAELRVQRERGIMREQERRITLDLSNAVAEARRAHSTMSLAERRFDAAIEYRAQAAERIESGRSQFDVLLEAQRRTLESQLQFINAEVEYAIAIKNVHFERGTFLEYHSIALAESESSEGAYVDYRQRLSERNKILDYVIRDTAIAKKPLAKSIPASASRTNAFFSPSTCQQDMCVCDDVNCPFRENIVEQAVDASQFTTYEPPAKTESVISETRTEKVGDSIGGLSPLVPAESSQLQPADPPVPTSATLDPMKVEPQTMEKKPEIKSLSPAKSEIEIYHDTGSDRFKSGFVAKSEIKENKEKASNAVDAYFTAKSLELKTKLPKASPSQTSRRTR